MYRPGRGFSHENRYGSNRRREIYSTRGRGRGRERDFIVEIQNNRSNEGNRIKRFGYDYHLYRDELSRKIDLQLKLLKQDVKDEDLFRLKEKGEEMLKANEQVIDDMKELIKKTEGKKDQEYAKLDEFANAMNTIRAKSENNLNNVKSAIKEYEEQIDKNLNPLREQYNDLGGKYCQKREKISQLNEKLRECEEIRKTRIDCLLESYTELQENKQELEKAIENYNIASSKLTQLYESREKESNKRKKYLYSEKIQEARDAKRKSEREKEEAQKTYLDAQERIWPSIEKDNAIKYEDKKIAEIKKAKQGISKEMSEHQNEWKKHESTYIFFMQKKQVLEDIISLYEQIFQKSQSNHQELVERQAKIYSGDKMSNASVKRLRKEEEETNKEIIDLQAKMLPIEVVRTSIEEKIKNMQKELKDKCQELYDLEGKQKELNNLESEQKDKKYVKSVNRVEKTDIIKKQKDTVLNDMKTIISEKNEEVKKKEEEMNKNEQELENKRSEQREIRGKKNKSKKKEKRIDEDQNKILHEKTEIIAEKRKLEQEIQKLKGELEDQKKLQDKRKELIHTPGKQGSLDDQSQAVLTFIQEREKQITELTTEATLAQKFIDYVEKYNSSKDMLYKRNRRNLELNIIKTSGKVNDIEIQKLMEIKKSIENGVPIVKYSKIREFSAKDIKSDGDGFAVFENYVQQLKKYYHEYCTEYSKAQQEIFENLNISSQVIPDYQELSPRLIANDQDYKKVKNEIEEKNPLENEIVKKINSIKEEIETIKELRRKNESDEYKKEMEYILKLDDLLKKHSDSYREGKQLVDKEKNRSKEGSLHRDSKDADAMSGSSEKILDDQSKLDEMLRGGESVFSEIKSLVKKIKYNSKIKELTEKLIGKDTQQSENIGKLIIQRISLFSQEEKILKEKRRIEKETNKRMEDLQKMEQLSNRIRKSIEGYKKENDLTDRITTIESDIKSLSEENERYQGLMKEYLSNCEGIIKSYQENSNNLDIEIQRYFKDKIILISKEEISEKREKINKLDLKIKNSKKEIVAKRLSAEKLQKEEKERQQIIQKSENIEETLKNTENKRKQIEQNLAALDEEWKKLIKEEGGHEIAEENLIEEEEGHEIAEEEPIKEQEDLETRKKKLIEEKKQNEKDFSEINKEIKELKETIEENKQQLEDCRKELVMLKYQYMKLEAEDTGSLSIRAKLEEVQRLLSGQRISDTVISQPKSPEGTESRIDRLCKEMLRLVNEIEDLKQEIKLFDENKMEGDSQKYKEMLEEKKSIDFMKEIRDFSKPLHEENLTKASNYENIVSRSKVNIFDFYSIEDLLEAKDIELAIKASLKEYNFRNEEENVSCSSNKIDQDQSPYKHATWEIQFNSNYDMNIDTKIENYKNAIRKYSKSVSGSDRSDIQSGGHEQMIAGNNSRNGTDSAYATADWSHLATNLLEDSLFLKVITQIREAYQNVSPENELLEKLRDVLNLVDPVVNATWSMGGSSQKENDQKKPESILKQDDSPEKPGDKHRKVTFLPVVSASLDVYDHPRIDHYLDMNQAGNLEKFENTLRELNEAVESLKNDIEKSIGKGKRKA